MSAFNGHLRSCTVCRRDFELESATRSLLRSAVAPVVTPEAVRRSVVDAIRAEARSAQRAERRDLWSVIFGRVPAPVVGFGLAAVLIAFLLFPIGRNDDLIRDAAANDVITQTATNFQLIRDGKVKPAITSCSPEQVSAYLESQHMPFLVILRPIERCDGYSAIVNEYDGVRLAHVVYKMGDDLLYVYQVRKEEAIGEKAHLTMPTAAREAIERTGWYTDPQHPDGNVVMWEDNGTLCAAASTMPKEKMMAVLASR
ncbi:MAG: hypothetical protein MUE68_03825 [Bacteroidetes bacterium]|nr:hypothetical protein [Bacteroidota bacterium]